MSDDLAAGRATEVEWINGEVVRLAARFGGQAPVNARLCALVHDAERAAARPARGRCAVAELTAQRRARATCGRVAARLAAWACVMPRGVCNG